MGLTMLKLRIILPPMEFIGALLFAVIFGFVYSCYYEVRYDHRFPFTSLLVFTVIPGACLFFLWFLGFL